MINCCPFSGTGLKRLRNSIKPIDIFLHLADCAPNLTGNPVKSFRDRLGRLNPCSANCHKPDFIVGDLLLCEQDLNGHEERINQLVFFQQASAERLIEENLELVDNILASVLFARNRFLDGSFKQVNIEFEGPLISGFDVGKVESDEIQVRHSLRHIFVEVSDLIELGSEIFKFFHFL